MAKTSVSKRRSAVKESCYMCDQAVTSREHVPPKCIFPAGKDLPRGVDYRKNLIKVPSCDEHNSHKSMDDEYIMFILASAPLGNDLKFHHFRTKILRAFERKLHVYSSFMKNVSPVIVQDHETGEIAQSGCFEVDLQRFDKAFFHMACGLLYHHYQEKWTGSYRVFTNLLVDMKSSKASAVNAKIQEVNRKVSELFSHRSTYGENGDVFNYRLLSDSKGQHAIHMMFYQWTEVTVLLSDMLPNVRGR